MNKPTKARIVLREAETDDVDALAEIENQAFEHDRMSRRRFRHWLQATHCIFLVADHNGQVCGYTLVLLHRGTRLARLYSLAVAPGYQGLGLSRRLLSEAEKEAAERKRLFMRLEVARSNEKAIGLYESMGYKVFGSLEDYYEDHEDALRMQKRVRTLAPKLLQKRTPWYQQTTSFTCGPASLLMAMGSLRPRLKRDRTSELDIWREATTIFMTSGHGGCHPVGLGLAAARRGFQAEVYLSTGEPLFVNGVRDPEKKEVVRLVDQQFREHAREDDVPIHQLMVSQEHIAAWIEEGCAVVILISTYRMDGRKAPHWVTVSGIDSECLYVHDPDPEKDKQDALDCQYMPIAREDFDRMSSFGKEKLRACVVLRRIRKG